jgi:phosphoenolpyruvate carboxykinase (GTP)
MLVPPKGLQQKGYRIWTVGDDIAWMRIDTDGRLWAVNPEIGLFGVAPGTNSTTNPNAMTAIRKNTICTNVILTSDGSVWWEGRDDPAPSEGLDWRGRPWNPKMKDENGSPVLGAHPNAVLLRLFLRCHPSLSGLSSTTACRSRRSSLEADGLTWLR